MPHPGPAPQAQGRFVDWVKRMLSRDRVVVTPTILQMDATECGAAALAIILAYHGRHVPLDELRLACGVSRDGTKANNLIKAARGYGLEGKGYTKDVSDLTSLALPAILFWDFSHFVVLEGLAHDRVYVNDPAKGRRAVSGRQFDESFTGVVLTFERTPAFRPGGERRTPGAAVARRLASGRRVAALLALCTAALVVPNIAIPVIAMFYVDQILIGGDSSWMGVLLASMVVGMAVKVALTHRQKRLSLTLSAELSGKLSTEFLWHVLSLPMSFFDQRHAGEIAPRVGLNRRVAAALPAIIVGATSVLSIAVYSAVLWFYDWVLALVGLGMAATSLLVMRFVSQRNLELNRRRAQVAETAQGMSIQGLKAIEGLKAAGGESDCFIRWAGHQAKVLNTEQELGRRAVWLVAMPSLLIALAYVAVLVIGGLRVMSGAMTIGMLCAFQLMMMTLLDPVAGLVSLEQKVQETKVNVDRLEDVLRHPTEARLPALGAVEADPITRLEGRIDLTEITFGYSALEPPMLRNFNLTVKAGQRIAIVGASGSGKSTVAKLIAGFYEPWSGEVAFDGRPRREIPRPVLSNSLAMVDQDVVLLQGTIRQNLALWDATLADQVIVEAARDAQIHEDILRRRGGYDAGLEEAGANFSGGQRQRMELARALAANPSILILDEATSALDPHVEHLVSDGVRRRGCTCVIVAHRLSTIRDCDEILVLDRGVVVQRGSHEQLAGVDGPYQRLIGQV